VSFLLASAPASLFALEGDASVDPHAIVKTAPMLVPIPTRATRRSRAFMRPASAIPVPFETSAFR
jgi:hypothetical protein